HTVVSNVKAFIAGTFHGLDAKHLQAYLNEFCYRFNRRRFKGELFNRLVKCCLSSPTITFTELTV
ncbi:MAG: transposase, partial [Desulfotomaculaceae bacterium]